MLKKSFCEEIALKENEGCILFDFACFFPYLNSEILTFNFSIGSETIGDYKLNHRYNNKNYITISKKNGRKVSNMGYPYIIKLSDQPYTALLKINVGIKDQYISLVFPIEIDLTPEDPVHALSFLYILEHNKFYFSANEKYWGNHDIAHNCESNFILLEQPNKLDEKTLNYDTIIIPGALCKGDPLWQP